MIDHITIPVNNLDLSRAFYEKSFIPLGYNVAFGKDGNFLAFAIGNGCLFEIAQYQGKTPLTPVHVAFRIKGKEAINAFYQAAIDGAARPTGPRDRGPTIPKTIMHVLF